MLTVAEWFSLHFQAILAMSSPAMGSSPPIVIVAIDIDIEIISCFLSENSVEKLSGIHGGLPNAPHVRVSLVLGSICTTFERVLSASSIG